MVLIYAAPVKGAFKMNAGWRELLKFTVLQETEEKSAKLTLCVFRLRE
jgi:hypothetical protein